MNPSEIYISYSAINDFLKCKSLYDMKYRFRNPKSGHKVEMANPYLTLGSIFEALRERLQMTSNEYLDLAYALSQLDNLWSEEQLSFGFKDSKQETEFKERAVSIVKRFLAKPSFVYNKPFASGFMKVNFGNQQNVYLCGSADWLEKNPDNTLTLIDFKTGRREESEDSLQLPIYKFLAENIFGLKVSKTYYWYLDWEDEPREVYLNSYEEGISKFFDLSEKLLSYVLQNPTDSLPTESCCSYCEPYFRIKNGQAKYVCTSKRLKRDLYLFFSEPIAFGNVAG